MSFRNDNYIKPAELARSLEQAGLLKLPRGRNFPALWNSFEWAKWELLKGRSQWALRNYLKNNPNDDARRKALDILEENVKHSPGGFYSETFHPVSEITEVILSSSDTSIRNRYLLLFGVSKHPSGFGDSALEVFDWVARDFKEVLEMLRPSDGNPMQALLESDDPQKVVFGLLMARKLSSPEGLRKLCQKIAARPNAKETVVYNYTVWDGCSRKDFTASLWELAKSLEGNTAVSLNSQPHERGGGCGVSSIPPTGDVF